MNWDKVNQTEKLRRPGPKRADAELRTQARRLGQRMADRTCKECGYRTTPDAMAFARRDERPLCHRCVVKWDADAERNGVPAIRCATCNGWIAPGQAKLNRNKALVHDGPCPKKFHGRSNRTMRSTRNVPG
jgi:hypothetical protein